MTSLILRFISKLRGLFGQGKANREFGDEIETHIELLTERLIRQGRNREDASWAARRQFGNTALLEQRQRDTRAFLWLTTVLQDVRYGLRMLARSPGVTAIAITSLALGIGANTAIFTLAKAALFDALSVPHPGELRLLAYTQDDRSVIRHDWGDFYSDEQGRTVVASFSYPVYQEMHHRDHSLGDLFAFVDLSQFEHLSATIDGHAEVVTAELVSGNFFQGMGVRTPLGRPIEPADDAVPGSGAVAVISDSFWQRRFDRSPFVVGKTVEVNLAPVTIIGVAPRGFSGASHVHTPQDLFLPLSMQPVIFPKETGSLLSDADTWWIQIMGRLQPSIPDEEARASLAVSLNQAIRSTMTVPTDRSVPLLFLLPGGRGWNYAAQELEHPMPFLLGLAGLVLLLACVNVANLLLARSSSRNREISVRLALGASNQRVIRQMLTESLCLSTLGGAAGLLLGYLGRNILPQLLSSSWGPSALSTRFDWRVFAFTLLISVLTGLGFGVGPAWQATRTSVNAALKDGGTTMTHFRRGIVGKVLVILQISLCMLLLVSAGLFVRTLANLNALDPGFNKRSLLLFALEPPVQRYPAPKNAEALHRVEERIASLPGVESVTLSREALLAQSGSNSDFMVEGSPRITGRDRHVPFNSVGQSFFTTMGIPILYGRSFDLRDTSSSPGVAVVNRALAQKEFAGRNPIGAYFRMKQGGERLEIVGVCADAKYAWLRGDDSPTLYVLYTQQKDTPGSMTYEVRTKGKPRDFADAIRSVVESVDKDLPLIEVRTQEEQIDATLAPERSFATVTTGFGILALLLASIGVYGVMAAGVSRRVNEIGVRMALGARADQVLRMVLGEAMSLAFAGVGAGLCVALLLTRLLNSLLFGLKPTDSLTLAGAGLLLSVVAILASWTPARRASRIQPVQALRHE
jgi:predicted permease